MSEDLDHDANTRKTDAARERWLRQLMADPRFKSLAELKLAIVIGFRMKRERGGAGVK